MLKYDKQTQKLCPFCKSVLRVFRPTVENRLYHECGDCQWIALDESFFISPEQQKERYLKHENTDQNQGYVEMFERFIKTCVEPFAPQGGRILDYGCGPEPVLAKLLNQRGYRVKTYDLFFDADESVLHEKYDVIVLTEVLEHLANPLEILTDLSRKLNPKGAIVLMTLFHPRDRDEFARWWYRRDPTHVTFYSVKTIEKIALVLGFTFLLTDKKQSAVIGIRP